MYHYDPSKIVSDEPADDLSLTLTDEDVDAQFNESDGRWVAREEAILRLPRSEQQAERDFQARMRRRIRFEIQVIRASGEHPENLTSERLTELWNDAG